jgi:DNA-binding NtrC family response regulator
MATILIIDDEEQVRLLFQVALVGAGYLVLTAESGNHGLRLLEYQEVDLVVVNVLMPDMDGLDLIAFFSKMRSASKIIAISGGSGEWDYLDAARCLGAHATLKKPFSPQELLDAVAGQLKSSHP